MKKRAVVTGASSGIGRETAIQLAGAGWMVLAVARREARLQALADEFPKQIFPFAADICDAGVPEQMVVAEQRHNVFAGGAP